MGADQGVERMTGSLLGYTREQNDVFIASWKKKNWNLVETLLRRPG
jgi:hypothetical protein